MGLPLVLATIGVGSQVAKGIAKNRFAKRRMREARAGLADAKALENQAWENRKDFNPTNLYANMDQQRNLLMNQVNSGAASNNVMNMSDARLSNLASQSNRVSSTTGQAQAGLLAGIKSEQEAAMAANQADIGDRSRSMELLMGLNAQQANLEDRAYQYNVQDPFNLRFGKSQSDRNAFYGMKLGAENMNLSAFGDYMNAVGSITSSGVDALGGLKSDSWVQKLMPKK